MTKTSTFPWSDIEREAWKLPDKITVSQWTDGNRVLDELTSAEPGQWRTDRAPYLRGIMDAFADPVIEEITIISSTQIGKTESLYNMMGYSIDQDPAPALYVMPKAEDVEQAAENRLKPMIFKSQALSSHVTGRADDLTKKRFHFDRMVLYFGSSNSPSDLASRPIRNLFLDETDKYPNYAGREADPIKLAKERTATFWNRKIVECSTPTTRDGYIYRAYQKSNKLRYHVPCPHCGKYQLLAFAQVK
ncbi:MAG: phage terminase large subunit family protein, partial [Candidatus Omnitrophica bacterium]|nr:phage terminase large subunit family protein [Candidatus Omnitrophota bacterium]